MGRTNNVYGGVRRSLPLREMKRVSFVIYGCGCGLLISFPRPSSKKPKEIFCVEKSKVQPVFGASAEIKADYILAIILT